MNWECVQNPPLAVLEREYDFADGLTEVSNFLSFWVQVTDLNHVLQ
jgi:hypothetical protein